MTSQLHTVESTVEQLVDWRVFARATKRMEEFEALHSPTRVRTSSLKLFPQDCLLLALGYLSKGELLQRSSRVTKHWYALTKHPLLWCSFSLQQLVTSSGLPMVHQGRHPEGYLHPKAYKEGFWMRAVADGRFQKLRELELQTADIGCRQLKRMLKVSPLLASIDLSHCQCVDDDLLDVICTSYCGQAATTHIVVGESFASETTGTLRCLKFNFSSEGKWTLDGMTGLFKTLGSQLTHLELSGIEHVNVSVFQCALLKLKCLTTLRARSSSMGPLAFVNVEVGQLHRLKVLDASCCLTVDDQFLAEVARCCPRLLEFHVSGCKQLTDRGMVQFRLRYQEHAKAKYVSSAAAAAAEGQPLRVTAAPHSTTLLPGAGGGGCGNFDDDDAACGGPSCLKVLGLESCVQLSDTSFASLSSAFPCLERLLVDRTNFGGTALKEAAKLGDSLKSLSIGNCLRLRKDVAFDVEARRLAQGLRHALKPGDRKFLQIK